MTDPADLVEWLTSVWDEDERIARKAGGDAWTLDGGIYRSHPVEEVVSYVYDEADEHIARHNPASVLARIAADRKVLWLHSGERDWPCQVEDCPYEICDTLRALASAYTDHSGFRDEWRVQ